MLQGAYNASGHELERRSIAVAFERAVRELDEGPEAEERAAAERELEAIIFADPVEIDLDALFADVEHAHRAVWARDLRATGLSLREIGTELGVAASTVSRWLADSAHP